MFVMKDNKVGPAHLKIASSPSYTLAELKALMKEWLNGEDNIAGSEELLLDWHLSLFVEWLAKREQGKEGRDDT